MYDHILIPTDGSPAVEAAIDEGVRLADLCDATIHGLYVVDTRDYNTLSESKWLTLESELQAEGERAVETVAERAREAEVDVRTGVRSGVPHEEILAYASESEIDAIVMRTHGRTGVDRFLLGSVTEKVARSADVPVLVIHADDEEVAGSA